MNTQQTPPIEDNSILIELTADVVSAYVGNNPVSLNDLPNLIAEVHVALGAASISATGLSAEKQKPAVPAKKSVHREYIICLEDGKKFKSLKRHIRTHYDLSPEEYREKWGLGHDYPMVAPAYAEARSRLAREMGLGRKKGTKIKKKV